MKKTVMTLALAAAGVLAAGSAFAQSPQSDLGGWFVNGNVGRTSVNNGPYDDQATGYAVNGGYRWAFGRNMALGVEVGYNDLGNIEAHNIFNSDEVYDDARSELHGWTAGVNGRINVTPDWYVSARTGVYGWEGHGLSSNENPLSLDVDNTDWYGGLGAGYNISRDLSVGVNYDYYHAEDRGVDLTTDMVSATLEYRF